MNIKAKYWYLKDFNFAKKIGMRKMMEMCELLEMQHFDRGEKIEYTNPNSVVFLKKGSVKILDRDSEQLKYIATRGNIFGLLFNERVNMLNEEYAVALDDVIVCFIGIEMMEELMSEHASLKNSVIKIQALRIRKLETRLSDLIKKDSATRIRDFLIAFVQENGDELDNKIEVTNFLSHKDIGHLTNTSRQTVNNVLSKLRKEGAIDYNRKKISVKLKEV